MASASMLCCFKGCLNGITNYNLSSNMTRISKENPIQLDTSYMGYEVVIVKSGQRLCGSGGALGNAPLVQSKAYFEVKVQQGGSWSVGLATRHTDLSFTQGGSDEHSWSLCSDGALRHAGKVVFQLCDWSLPEGDVIGITYDHIQLKFYVNGAELDGATITNVKGTVFPALYVDDGAILDIILDNFNYPPPASFDRIMLEQSLL